MINLQLVRFSRSAAVALSAGLALVSVATAPAFASPGAGSAAKGNTLGTAARTGLTAGPAGPSPVGRQFALPGGGAVAGARSVVNLAGTTCVASVGAPQLIGGGRVLVDYSVSCNNLVSRIEGIVGIVRNRGELLGRSVDGFNAANVTAYSNSIVRPCTSGALYGDMLARVTYRNGTPRQITREFVGPEVHVSC